MDDVTRATWDLTWAGDARRRATLYDNGQANRAFRSVLLTPEGYTYINDYYDPDAHASWGNVPAIAGRYLTSRFRDGPNDTFGWGVTNADAIQGGVQYVVHLDLYRDQRNEDLHPVGWQLAAAYQKEEGCTFGVAQCTFADQFIQAIREGDFQVTQNGAQSSKSFNWKHTLIQGNPDFEYSDGTGTLAGWTTSPNTYVDTVCEGGFESQCYAWLRRGSNGIQGDTILKAAVESPVKVDWNLTAEAVVRCTVAGGCDARISYRAFTGANFEWRSEQFLLPNDGAWYFCRVDFSHGGAAKLTADQTSIAVELQLNNAAPLDVDYVTLSTNYYDTVLATDADNANTPLVPNDGADCVFSGENVFAGGA